MLTVVIPTRNRPRHCAAQLDLFRRCSLTHRVVVADSSDPDQAEAVRGACAKTTEYRHFDHKHRLADKLGQVIGTIQTPFVALVPDDDITFPHALDVALAHLKENPDYVAAHGYVLDFELHGGDFDIHHLHGFSPSITEEDPLQRHYHLMRRYQPFYWSVFRREALVASVTAAQSMDGIVFRELTVMNTAVLQGKVARLASIHRLRSAEDSMTPLAERHPFYWFLRDADSFFRNYVAYRNGLVRFVEERGIPAPRGGDLAQALDLVHATFFGRVLDFGVVNYAAQRLLGEPLPPIPAPRNRESGQAWGADDRVRQSESVPHRCYVWRQSVLTAQPRDETAISLDEIVEVQRQLDAYDVSSLTRG